jgi:hypothetical protein
MTQVPKTTSFKQIFKSLRILPLPSLYIYETLIYIKSNSNNFATNSGLHSYNTWIKYDLHNVPCNTSLCKNNFKLGLQLLNHLPPYIKEMSVLRKFKNALKTYLLDHCFYKVDEFLSCETNTKQLQSHNSWNWFRESLMHSLLSSCSKQDRRRLFWRDSRFQEAVPGWENRCLELLQSRVYSGTLYQSISSQRLRHSLCNYSLASHH